MTHAPAAGRSPTRAAGGRGSRLRREFNDAGVPTVRRVLRRIGPVLDPDGLVVAKVVEEVFERNGLIRELVQSHSVT